MTSFARGTPGLGLLILRFTVTFNMIAVLCHCSVAGTGEILPFAIAILGILLLLGFFTWISSCAAGTLLIASVALLRETTWMPIATVGLLCLVLALAGPGAYSLDALLWGPRRITYPSE